MSTDIFSETLDKYRSEGRLRSIPHEPGEGMIDLCSNDYLGLSLRSADFMSEFLDRFPDAAFSSSASRLLSPRQKYHSMLEEFLHTLYHKEILLFNSGYHANVGTISALASLPSTLFVCDKLIHASVIDGIALGRAEFRRFRHNDVFSLKSILAKFASSFDRVIVVVESIYSMDGDTAPLPEIIALKKEYPSMMLYVDEAHALGVRGSHGLGEAERLGLTGDVDILIGTFGKACASAGAFVAASAEIHDFLINSARSFIFSTAMPPVNMAWTLLMMEKIVGMTKERKYLSQISGVFRRKIEETTGAGINSDSQIIPLHIGDAAKAVAVAEKLRRDGITALPIRRPTVPPGGERIRFSLNAALTEQQIDYVMSKLTEL